MMLGALHSSGAIFIEARNDAPPAMTSNGCA